MAQIIEKPSPLKRQYNKAIKKVKTFALFSVIFILAAILGSIVAENLLLFGICIIGISVLGFIICVVFWAVMQNNINILKSGIEGELATANALSSLPAGYHIFQNAVIPSDEKTSELDLIVIGENGVFVVESKSRNGRITGNFSGTKWTQHKIGAGGGEYSVDFYSPIKQVGTHIFRLAHFLQSNNIKTHINGIVYFSNQDADVHISGNEGSIPVITKKSALKQHILKGENLLNEDEIQHICKILSDM